MTLRVVSGTANRPLAAAVAVALRIELTACEIERFPDGELRPVVENVRGDDVYLIEPTGPPVNENLVELLLLLDACRRGGAGRITAVLPYFGYARQDRRGRAGEAVGARVVADALVSAGAQRLVVGIGRNVERRTTHTSPGAPMAQPRSDSCRFRNDSKRQYSPSPRPAEPAPVRDPVDTVLAPLTTATPASKRDRPRPGASREPASSWRP